MTDDDKKCYYCSTECNIKSNLELGLETNLTFKSANMLIIQLTEENKLWFQNSMQPVSVGIK